MNDAHGDASPEPAEVVARGGELGALATRGGDLLLLQLLLESVQDYAIFILDPSGRVASWNRGAERIKGYTAGEIIGRHFSCFYPEEDVQAGKCERELEIAAREGRFEDEGWRIRKDGSRFWANVIITALRDADGRHLGFAKVTRDLTIQRLAEEERVRLAQAKEAVRLREVFLSIASHELRTPLTALDLQVHSLTSSIDTLDPRLAKKVRRIERSSARLQQLIGTLLDVSRIATGRFSINRARSDLVVAVQDVVDRLAEHALDADCEVTLDKQVESAFGEWDMLRIEQVIMNVLENALKYGAGRPVRLVVGADEREVEVTVVDGGPGIPEQDRERIFGRFERSASVRHYGGLGLGLYVSREIVSAHGGSISAENEPSGGARFTIRLPRSVDAASRVV